MPLNRREFILKTAAISGAEIFSAPVPLLVSVKSAVAEIIDIPKPVLLQDARKTVTRLGIDRHIWNWREDAGTSVAMPANYYEASLSEWPELGILSADQTCDVVIVDGGLLGVSTALHLAEAGLEAIVIEKDGMGLGASGRNGGQITPGLARRDAMTMLPIFQWMKPDVCGASLEQRLWILLMNFLCAIILHMSANKGISL